MLSAGTRIRAFAFPRSRLLLSISTCIQRRVGMASSSMASTAAPGKAIRFGPFHVTEQVFLTTAHSFALVNLKPLAPGHVLICPLRPHERLTDLEAQETADLFTTVQLAQRMLARVFFPRGEPKEGGGFTVAVQDGRGAGQTVPHVHVHVIPRVGVRDATGTDTRTSTSTSTSNRDGDGDQIYVDMASEKGNVGGALWDRDAERPRPGGGMPKIEDEDRRARTEEEMNEEAERYRLVLREMGVK